MAKNKKPKKNNGGVIKMSTPKFMREKARTLPVGKCYISPEDWETSPAGMVEVIITRRRGSGNLVVADVLVDMLCLGVKDCFVRDNMTPEMFDEYMEHYSDRMTFAEIDYVKAHNLILGAIDFAEEGGVKPCQEWSYAQYILDEDSDDIPIIEYEYGRDGHHVLVIGPDGKERRYLNTLEQHLDDDLIVDKVLNFVPKSQYHEYPDEDECTFPPADYPAELNLEHPDLLAPVLALTGQELMSEELVDTLLASGQDLAADLGQIILYQIGKTRQAIIDDNIEGYDPSLFNAFILLADFGNEKAIPAVTELLRQSSDFIDFHFGDIFGEVSHPSIARTFADNIDTLADFSMTPGLHWHCRVEAQRGLCDISWLYPEKKEEAMAAIGRIIDSLPERIEALNGASPNTAAFLISHLEQEGLDRFGDQIKSLYDNDLVDCNVTGFYEEHIGFVSEKIGSDFAFKDTKDLINHLKRFD